MSTPRELLTFPGLRADDRARLGRLRRCAASSRATYDDLERPRPRGLAAPHAAATRLWEPCGARCSTPSSTAATTTCPRPTCGRARRRMAGTRDRSAREVMGTIEGGYQVLVDRARRRDPRPRRRGPDLDAGALRAVLATAARSASCSTRACAPHDTVVTTQLRPGLAAPAGPRPRRPRSGPTRRATSASSASSRACAHSVSPYYALNITDRSRAADERRRDDARRRPRARPAARCSTSRSTSTRTARSSSGPRAEIRREYLGHVAAMFPAFDPADVLARAGRPRPGRRAGPRPGRPARRARGRLRRRPGLAVASSARRLPGPRQRPGRPRRGRAPRRGPAGPPRRGRRGGAGRVSTVHAPVASDRDARPRRPPRAPARVRASWR